MKRILTLITLVILLTGCNKTKSITCSATEVDEESKTTTKVISKYNYDSKGIKINSIDYIIEISGELGQEKAVATKNMFENTICGKNKPDNVKCEILLEDDLVKLEANEVIENNKSSLLGVENLDKLTYDKFKENEQDNNNCKYE